MKTITILTLIIFASCTPTPTAVIAPTTPTPTAVIAPATPTPITIEQFARAIRIMHLQYQQLASIYTYSQCDCSLTCEQLSCAQSRYQLTQCGCTQRDSDGDGIPCEAQCAPQ